MEVIDRINLRLAEIGKTGAEMSRALQLSNSIYSQWNTKKTKPSKKTLVKVAEYLDVPVEYLLTGKEPKKQLHAQGEELSDARKKALQFIEGLSDDQLDRFINMGRAALEMGGSQQTQNTPRGEAGG